MTTIISANDKLRAAKAAKNDEFYTRFKDINDEVMAYVDYNADAFRDKTILLPCDDPEWSNFTLFFALRFDTLGLKKLISTSYNPGGQGKVFTLERDVTGDGRTDISDLTWKYLDGDGDFRSDEVRALRDESDIIVTNPPFSIYRDFLKWLTEENKQFLFIGNKSAISNKDTFPLIHAGKMWSGVRPWAGGMWFELPADAEKWDRIDDGVKMGNVPSIWYTNMDHGRRHNPLSLQKLADNLRFNEKFTAVKFDNYDALYIPETKLIPSDYDGVMGVPTTFIDKFCPEQFEIIGITENGDAAPVAHLRIPGCLKYDRPYVDGKRKFPYILIQHRRTV